MVHQFIPMSPDSMIIDNGMRQQNMKFDTQ